jgi:FkbM family methyltransferase
VFASVTVVDQMVELTKTTARTALPEQLYGPLRAHRVRRQVELYTPHTVRHSYAGFPLDLLLADPLAEAWYDHDWEEPPELGVLRGGRLGPGARIFDIGAHQAVVALILAAITGPEGEIVAVEAEPHNARVAQANVTANGARNVTVLHAAGAAREGRISFTESLNGAVASRRGAPGAVEVPAVTVDGLAKRFGTPDVVFIDVEGYEAHVLEGAAETLAAGASDFMVEVHDAEALARAGSTAADVVSHFAGGSFEVEIGEETGRLWRKWRPQMVMDGKRSFLYAQPLALGSQ